MPNNMWTVQTQKKEKKCTLYPLLRICTLHQKAYGPYNFAQNEKGKGKKNHFSLIRKNKSKKDDFSPTIIIDGTTISNLKTRIRIGMHNYKGEFIKGIEWKSNGDVEEGVYGFCSQMVARRKIIVLLDGITYKKNVSFFCFSFGGSEGVEK